MTYSVFITPTKQNVEKTKEMWGKLNEEFTEIHNQNFEQEVNIRNRKGVIRKMQHGLSSRLCLDDHGFFTIPCHWDYDHMVQTAKDIRKVMKNNGFKRTRIRLSY